MFQQPEEILKLPAVKKKTGKSRSSIYADMAEGRFPRPIPLGGLRAVGWLSSEIDGWLQMRIAERDSKSPKTA